MSTNVHIKHIRDTLANVWSNADAQQLTIVSDEGEALGWKDNDNTTLYVGAVQKSTTNGAAWTYEDNDFGSVNVRDDSGLFIAKDLVHLGDPDTLVRLTDDQVAIAAGGVSMFTIVEGADDYVQINSGSADVDLIVNGSSSSLLRTDAANDRVGILESAPSQVLEITCTAPYAVFHNSTSEDIASGRECRFIAVGHRSGDEEITTGYLEFAHDGASDDDKGVFRVMLNDGDDGAAPSVTGMEIESSGKVSIGASSLTNEGDVQLLKDGVLALKETTTPTADTDYGKIYCKNDNKLYFQDGAGAEHEIAFV